MNVNGSMMSRNTVPDTITTIEKIRPGSLLKAMSP